MGKIKLPYLLIILSSFVFALPTTAKSLFLYNIKFETEFSLIKNALPKNKNERDVLINKAIAHHSKYLLFKLNEYNFNDELNVVTPVLSSFDFKLTNISSGVIKHPPYFPKLKYVQNVGSPIELSYVKKAVKTNYKTRHSLDTVEIKYSASLDFHADADFQSIKALENKLILPNDPYFLYFYFPRTEWKLTKSTIRNRSINAPVCTSQNESLEFPEQNFWYYWSPYRKYKGKSCINDLEKKNLLTSLKITDLNKKRLNTKGISLSKIKDITIYLGTIKTNYKDIFNNKESLRHIDKFLALKDFKNAKDYLNKNNESLNPTLINFLITTWSLERFYTVKSKKRFTTSNYIKINLTANPKDRPNQELNITLFFGDTDKEDSSIHKELLLSKINSDAIIYIGHAGHGETLPKNILRSNSKNPRVIAFLSCFSKSYVNLKEVNKKDTLITTGNSYRDIESKALFSLLELLNKQGTIVENSKYLTKKIPVFIEKGQYSERI